MPSAVGADHQTIELYCSINSSSGSSNRNYPYVILKSQNDYHSRAIGEFVKSKINKIYLLRFS
jgi:hypothetical protein